MKFISQPLHRLQIRELSNVIRKTLDLEKVLYFPVIPFLEGFMPVAFPNFYIEIVPKEYFPI